MDKVTDKVVLGMEGFIHKFLQRRIYISHPDYKDLVQESWVYVMKALSTYDSSKGAITTHTYYHLMDMFKRYCTKRDYVLEYIEDDYNVNTTSVDNTMMLRDLSKKIPDKHVKVCNMYIAGYSTKDIAESTGFSISGVKFILQEIKKKVGA